MSKIIIGFIIGVMFGYFWGYTVMKKYEANFDNCKDYLQNNLYISSDVYSFVLEDFFSEQSKNKGDVFYYYLPPDKCYKIRRIK